MDQVQGDPQRPDQAAGRHLGQRAGLTYWVKAFRSLAENIANGLAKGDPVLVTGELTISEYRDNDGVTRTARGSWPAVWQCP